MSREIKFRAYQKTPSLNHKPSLYEVTGLDFYEGDYGGGEVCLRNKKGEQWTEYIKDVVLEQYTGLKDKNGKKIYEGDIVKMPDWKVSPKFEVVRFTKLSCGFEPFVNGCMDCMSPDGEEVEVIGNIHENQDLLGGEE